MNRNYAETKINWITFTEGFLIFYFLFGLIQAFYYKNYGSMPLLLMACTGFSMVFGYSIYESRKKSLGSLHD
jgi:hypothetical protein